MLRTVVLRMARKSIAMSIALTSVVTAHVAIADTTVEHDGADDAPVISLIGDSTLSGVRWYDDYGALRQYDFVFDAESCRRTLDGSCWSREGYRPENAMAAMDRLDGELGEVLVMMTGYNDASYGFDEAVDAVVAEAQDQGIAHVVWLTLRTAEVSYEEPLHLANANTYRESNRVLFDKADEYGGYLQVADWATYSADREGWFSYDGVHLTEVGVDGVTSYIADVVTDVLAGTTVTPAAPAWEDLDQGDWGETVADVQQALIDAGVGGVGGADGSYGEYTADAVEEFQRGNGLDVTGIVDEPTAVALGLHVRPPDPLADALRADTPSAASSVPLGTVAPAPVANIATDRSTSSLESNIVLAALGGAALLALALLVRRRIARKGAHREALPEPAEPAGLLPQLPVPVLYDYEHEDVLVHS